MSRLTPWILWTVAVVLISLGAARSFAQTNAPPEPFMGPKVHEVLRYCAERADYLTDEMGGQPRDLETEKCWRDWFRSSPEFRSELKDAGWRLTRLWFSGKLEQKVNPEGN